LHDNVRISDRDQSSEIGAVLAIALVLILLLLGAGGFMFYRTRAAQQAAMVAEMRALEAAQRAEESRRQIEADQRAEESPRRIEANQQPQELRFVGWNVESGGNDPAVISQQLAELGPYDVYGLTEVSPSNTRRYAAAAAIGNSYKSLVTVTGRSDRMMIVYNGDRLKELEHAELEAHDGVRMNDVNFGHRSPLMVKFRDKHSGIEFLVVLNHLARGIAELRQEQAKALRLWAEDQELPIIGIGDYNFDFDFPTYRGNAAFHEFLADGIWRWVQPDELIDTNWSDRDGDGKDNYPHSCLDFTFVAGKAKQWQSQSRVIVRDGDFPDDDKTSDHRPVELIVTMRQG
jgi:endonuclease/exonuclease/phosphatase family metal-dependent hydrolase